MPRRGTGTITKYFADRNFGFIKPDDGSRDLHFRSSSIEGTPSEGLRVEFLASEGPKGPEASDIKAFKDSLPTPCVFETFYSIDEQNAEKTLRPEIFYVAPLEAAKYLERQGLTSSALRMLFQGLRFAQRVKDRKISFEKGKELFGGFYVEKVVRQNKRGLLPDAVVELFDIHKDVILANEAEMYGFFKYLTYVLCFFGDKVK